MCPTCTLHNHDTSHGGSAPTCAACRSPFLGVSRSSAALPAATSDPGVHPLGLDPGWDCPMCTLRNERDALLCAACGEPRPIDGPKHLSIIPAKDLHLDADMVLGRGSFGTVQRGKWCGSEVAVKGSGTSCLDRTSLLREQAMCVPYPFSDICAGRPNVA